MSEIHSWSFEADTVYGESEDVLDLHTSDIELSPTVRHSAVFSKAVPEIKTAVIHSPIKFSLDKSTSAVITKTTAPAESKLTTNINSVTNVRKPPALVKPFTVQSKIDLYKQPIPKAKYKKSISLKSTYNPRSVAKAPSGIDSSKSKATERSTKAHLPSIFGLKTLPKVPKVPEPVLPVVPTPKTIAEIPTIRTVCTNGKRIPIHQRLGQRPVTATVTSGRLEYLEAAEAYEGEQVITIRHVHEFVEPAHRLSRGAKKRRQAYLSKIAKQAQVLQGIGEIVGNQLKKN